MTEKYQSILEKWQEFEEQGAHLSEERASDEELSLEKIKENKLKALMEFEKSIDTLETIAINSRFEYSQELATAQLEYFQEIRKLLVNLENEKDEEVQLLHAEFSLDFAKQSALYAILSTLQAIETSEKAQKNY